MELFRLGPIAITWRDGVDILFLSLLLYGLLRWFQRIRLLGIALLLFGFVTLLRGVSLLGLKTISFVLQQVITWLGVVLAVILAPELRRLLHGFRFLPGLSWLRQNPLTEEQAQKVVDELIEALQLLAKNNLGALIVLENNDDLSSFMQTGDSLQAPVEARMFLMIFEKKSPLHDGAVIVRGERIVAARCTLPLSDRLDLPQSFGQRHRAAIGITEQTDAITLVVSEETGIISLAQSGELKRMALVELKKLLLRFYLR